MTSLWPRDPSETPIYTPSSSTTSTSTNDPPTSPNMSGTHKTYILLGSLTKSVRSSAPLIHLLRSVFIPTLICHFTPSSCARFHPFETMAPVLRHPHFITFFQRGQKLSCRKLVPNNSRNLRGKASDSLNLYLLPPPREGVVHSEVA